MTDLVVLRHAPTEWNEHGLIQGRTDSPLSPAGRRIAAAWRLPPAFAGYDWLSSPLERAIETARAMGGEPAIEPRLTELHWGDWAGCSLPDLRLRLGRRMVENEARGLDFRPEGGESYREVQERLRPLLAERAETGRPSVAVTHKGVILALYALAAGWAMTSRPPDRLRDGCCHRFVLAADGTPAVGQVNIPLAEGGPAA